MTPEDKAAFNNWWQSTGGGRIGEKLQAEHAVKWALNYARQQSTMNQNEQMREALRMIDTIVDAAFDGGSYDGSEIQDMAVEHGLLKQEEMKEPCAGNCTCLEAGAEFPTQCYRKTYKQALAAEPAPLVRLTGSELLEAYMRGRENQRSNVREAIHIAGLIYVQDALIAKNGGK